MTKTEQERRLKESEQKYQKMLRKLAKLEARGTRQTCAFWRWRGWRFCLGPIGLI